MSRHDTQVSGAAEVKYLPIGKAAAEKSCAKAFKVPNSTYCPLTLMEVRPGAYATVCISRMHPSHAYVCILLLHPCATLCISLMQLSPC